MSDSPNRRNEHLWGRSTHLYLSEKLDLAVATGKAGGASSMHTHRHKANTFIVESGTVIIELDERAVKLSAGESTTIPAGYAHRMIFKTDARLYELYYAIPGQMIDLADIQRLKPGWKPDEGSHDAQD